MAVYALCAYSSMLNRGFDIKKMIPTLTTKKVVTVSALANFITTVVGVPVAFIVTLLPSIIGSVAAPNVYFEKGTSLEIIATIFREAVFPNDAGYRSNTENTVITVGIIIITILPLFFVSWLLEYFVAKKMIKDVPTKLIEDAEMYANLASYVGFTVFAIVLYTSNDAGALVGTFLSIVFHIRSIAF